MNLIFCLYSHHNQHITSLPLLCQQQHYYHRTTAFFSSYTGNYSLCYLHVFYTSPPPSSSLTSRFTFFVTKNSSLWLRGWIPFFPFWVLLLMMMMTKQSGCFSVETYVMYTFSDYIVDWNENGTCTLNLLGLLILLPEKKNITKELCSWSSRSVKCVFNAFHFNVFVTRKHTLKIIMNGLTWVDSFFCSEIHFPSSRPLSFWSGLVSLNPSAWWVINDCIRILSYSPAQAIRWM